MPEDTGKIKTNYNTDLVSVDEMYNRVIEEIFGSVSAGMNRWNKFDKQRVIRFISAMRFKLDYLVKQAELDQGKTHPVEQLFEPGFAPTKVENESMNALLLKLIRARDNSRRSGSTRMSSGIDEFDAERQYSYIKDFEVFIQDYVDKATPLDFVESSPRRVISPEGKIFEPGKA